MLPTRGSTSRAGRALIASLALVATLIAAGVPVLHAWAHEFGQGHDDVVTGQAAADHAHDEVHPPSLHDECLLTHRASMDVALAPPASPLLVGPLGGDAAPVIHAVAPVASRAPPGHDRARAPPFA